MKAKIDLDGNLHVIRAGRSKPQLCLYSDHDISPCGDWCPKFEEGSQYDDGRGWAVTVCGGPTYEIIADERPKGTDNAAE